jgi:hypothetical protein
MLIAVKEHSQSAKRSEATRNQGLRCQVAFDIV